MSNSCRIRAFLAQLTSLTRTALGKGHKEMSNSNTLVVAITVTMSFLFVACGGNDGASSRLGSKLKDCGLVTSGDIFPNVVSPFGECYLDCMASGSCNELARSQCTQTPLAGACNDKCDDGFTCDDGEQITAEYVCDGDNDCRDASDEFGCSLFECSSGWLIPAAWQCDFFDDCGDGSDEDGCAITLDSCE